MSASSIVSHTDAIKPYAMGLIRAQGPVTIRQIAQWCHLQHKNLTDFETPLEFFYYDCDIRNAVTELIRDGKVMLYADTEDGGVSFDAVD